MSIEPALMSLAAVAGAIADKRVSSREVTRTGAAFQRATDFRERVPQQP